MALRQLAGQTFWYGLSNVAARLISFLLTPILTYLLPDGNGQVEYGNYSILYAYLGILNIIFTYGLETGYFYLVNKEGVSQKTLFNTTLTSHIISTIVLISPIFFFYKEINAVLELGSIPSVVLLMSIIIAFDTLSTIPFAQLRQNNRPKLYALIRIIGILLNVFLVILFLYVLPKYFGDTVIGWLSYILNTEKLILIIFANVAQSFITFVLLSRVWKSLNFQLNLELLRRILLYSLPMIIIGLGGMVNEVLDRIMLDQLLTVSRDEAKTIVGIYNANYKIAIFITLFIQAFRMAAEPFFFKEHKNVNAKNTYAMVMKWFVITLCIAFLFTILFLDSIILMIAEPYRIKGFGIIPILLLANVFLGIYYNLSVWYKVTNNMKYGILVTLIGALITVVMNYLLIPSYGMYAAAIATLLCYGSMVMISYWLGQRHYPIPYKLSNMLFHLGITLVISSIMILIRIFFLQHIDKVSQIFCGTTIGIILLVTYIYLITSKENIPVKMIISKVKNRFVK